MPVIPLDVHDSRIVSHLLYLSPRESTDRSCRASYLSISARTNANARNIAWLRLHDDIGLTNQVWALKTESGIQKCRRAVRLPFQRWLWLSLIPKNLVCVLFDNVIPTSSFNFSQLLLHLFLFFFIAWVQHCKYGCRWEVPKFARASKSSSHALC